jgi:2-polyprenyl-3-methyl-5-hydroxy-6-metoxy-1,4-benzoquinol methylase
MWKKEYKKRKFYWALKPDSLLVKYLSLIPKGKVLDIGAGEGRNSVFLAQNGFKVEAIDINKERLEKCREIAEKYHLPIETKAIDIRNFEFKPNKYSLILDILTLSFLKFSEISKIIPKIKKSLKRNGIFYMVAFSTKDPAFKRLKFKKLEIDEKNTFYLPKLKIFRHFFEKRELLKLLKNFEILKIEERKLRDTSHSGIHFHRIIIAIVKKRTKRSSF